MDNFVKNNRLMILFLVVVLFLPINIAHAYIDPGSGSYIVQIVIGAAVGAAYTIKCFGRNIINYLKAKFSRKKRKNE